MIFIGHQFLLFLKLTGNGVQKKAKFRQLQKSLILQILGVVY